MLSSSSCSATRATFELHDTPEDKGANNWCHILSLCVAFPVEKKTHLLLFDRFSHVNILAHFPAT
jgi:hypothetical protein